MFYIGNVLIKSKAILAPMAGICDESFCALCNKFGAGLVVSEMISAKAILYNNTKTINMLINSNLARPFAIQLFGNNSEDLARASKIVEARVKPDIIDINMGCPVKKIVKDGSGSSLLLDTKKVGQIVKAVVDAVNVPVTVKIRLGWDRDHINAVEIAKVIESNGAAAITVHGRTRSEFYSGKADWDMIKKVKESVNIPVIGNGDIISPEEFKEALLKYKVDAIAIGRASIGNPYIFKEINDYLNNGTYHSPSKLELLNIILEHIDLMLARKPSKQVALEIRPHLSNYLKGIKNSKSIKNQIYKTDNINDIIKLIREVLDE